MNLCRYSQQAATSNPGQIAITAPGGQTISYRDLDALSDRLHTELYRRKIQAGDRVGIQIRKSVDSIAVLLGVLKAGAVCVPVDPTAPSSRNAIIFSDCRVSQIISESCFEHELHAGLDVIDSGFSPGFLIIEDAEGSPASRLETLLPTAEALPCFLPARHDLAYILYTSGSTGKPKGIKLSHHNIRSFVEWAAEVLQTDEHDCFCSHAPLHFDLSILDLYLAQRSCAMLALTTDALSKSPAELTRYVAESGVTIWYSTPSLFTLVSRFGQPEQQDFSRLRHVLFAGEVFPVSKLRQLMTQLPAARYFNFYGPTETNVCTSFEVPGTLPADQTEPVPIGSVCTHLQSRVVDTGGSDVEPGETGELCIHGDSVMQGYWGDDAAGLGVFLPPPANPGWYRTGDLVREDAPGIYRYIGRRDRMVKKRGYRVEPGEIEASLHLHEHVREAAVTTHLDAESGLIIVAHISTCDGQKLSLIQMKQFCSSRLPIYMVPDRFQYYPYLPKTSTGKIDYQSLTLSIN